MPKMLKTQIIRLQQIAMNNLENSAYKTFKLAHQTQPEKEVTLRLMISLNTNYAFHFLEKQVFSNKTQQIVLRELLI